MQQYWTQQNQTGGGSSLSFGSTSPTSVSAPIHQHTPQQEYSSSSYDDQQQQPYVTNSGQLVYFMHGVVNAPVAADPALEIC